MVPLARREQEVVSIHPAPLSVEQDGAGQPVLGEQRRGQRALEEGRDRPSQPTGDPGLPQGPEAAT